MRLRCFLRDLRGDRSLAEIREHRTPNGTQGTHRAPLDLAGIDWVIVGGESGPGARPMEISWAREIIAAARIAGAAPFVKQLGSVWARGEWAKHDPKGGDWDGWSPDLRVREFPAVRAVSA